MPAGAFDDDIMENYKHKMENNYMQLIQVEAEGSPI